MKKENKKLRIAAVLDGTPGHEKQTLAVIKALSRRVQTDVDMIRVRKKSALQTAKSILWLAAGRFSPPGGWKGNASLDFIIGTGSSTHLPILHLKGKSRAKAVACMTPDFFLKKKNGSLPGSRARRDPARGKYFFHPRPAMRSGPFGEA
jgi:uncharacterized protein